MYRVQQLEASVLEKADEVKELKKKNVQLKKKMKEEISKIWQYFEPLQQNFSAIW